MRTQWSNRSSPPPPAIALPTASGSYGIRWPCHRSEGRTLRPTSQPSHSGAHPGPPTAVSNVSALYAVTAEYGRSEEHTSELQSLAYLVCRLLLEKKKNRNSI